MVAMTIEGPLSTVLERFRLMLADCVSVRTFLDVSVGSSAPALAKIYADALPPPEHNGEFTQEELHAMRPFILVELDDETGFHASAESEGTRGFMGFSGTINAIFEKEISDAQMGDPAAYLLEFRNEIGNVVSQLIERSGAGTWLLINKLWVTGPVQPEPQEQATLGNPIRYFMRIDWGRA